MSTFDDPFDAERELTRSGCVCGQHRSAAEHDQAALALRCEEVAREDRRYEGVVASAVMRAVFPKDAARRAFLKSVGASTALAALSQFFPIKAATEAFADAGMRLALSYRNEDDKERTAEWFAAKGYAQPLFLNLDVTDRARFAEGRA